MSEWLSMHAWTPGVIVSLVAVAVAAAAWVTSRKALAVSYQPMIRVVPVRGTYSIAGDMVILKNIGRGVAMAIVVIPDGGNEAGIHAEVDVLEPLGATYGPGFVESSRVGRALTYIRHPNKLQVDRLYRVLYQDIAGAWHETQFTPTEGALTVRMLGPRQPEDVPAWVRERAQIVRCE